MKVLALIASKGGSGKTTAAASLAVAAAEDGEVVVVVDTDPQGSLMAWHSRRQADGIESITYRPLNSSRRNRVADPSELADLLRRLREHGATTLVIIDTAGIAGPGAMIVARAADLVIVPCRPTQLDFDAAQATVAALQGVQASFRVMISQTPTMAPERARAAAGEIVKLGTSLPAYTGSRVAYADAMGGGLGVTEHEPRGRAADEVRAIWTAIKESV